MGGGIYILQHITTEQLNELTLEQKERLRERWRPKTYDIVIDDNNNDYVIEVDKKGSISFVMDSEGIIPPQKKTDFLPLLSVGQMIEVLQDKIAYFSMTNIFAGTGGKFCWGVMKPKHFDIRADELCVALWQEVKAVL